MKLKRLDYVVIVSLALFTVGSFVTTLLLNNRNFDKKYVEISVDGKFYKRLPLENYTDSLKIETKLGTNIIEIENGKVHVEDADCPDKVCIKDGFISKPGEILVCLPNKVVIQVKGEVNQELDDSSF